jgi:hypothetical protein
MWLRDCLPQDLPKVRIFTFGYNSTLRSSTSTSSIRDFARQLLNAMHSVRAGDDDVRHSKLNVNISLTATKNKSRPIIFIAHSMGGLVVKDASTSLILFFEILTHTRRY